jgi:uncharacterized protein (TIGR00266 family)
MRTDIAGGPAFCHLNVELQPGESIVAESDAMVQMAADLDLAAVFNGGFFSGLLKKFLGGESLFVNVFTNNSDKPRRLTLVQGTPGEMRELKLDGGSICLQPGAYVASTPGLKLGVRWAGFRSLIAREGLFKLVVSGHGKLWYGAYGALVERQVDGEFIVDSGHLVAYDPSIRLRIQLSGGLFQSFFSGEGLVTRVEGQGKVILQTRSLGGLAGWVNPRL